MYHRGYYNQKSNKFFIQEQLFCAPTDDTDVLRLLQSLMKAKGQQVTQGCLDKSTLSELRDDLLNNWKILYSNPDYQPYKNFSGGPVDRESNRQIYRKHFTQVPYSRTWWIPLKLYFLTFPLTWCGCYANQKKVIGFRGGTKTFTWVVESPRLLLSMLEVK